MHVQNTALPLRKDRCAGVQTASIPTAATMLSSVFNFAPP